MARPMTTPQRTALGAPLHRTHVQVLVENPDGAMTDVTAFLGTNWFKRARWDEKLDRPVMQGTLTLGAWRNGISLIPTIGASPANRTATNQYARFLEGGRRVTIKTDVTLPGGTPSYRSVFEGYLDDTEIAENAQEIALPMRDLGARLADRIIETPVTLGGSGSGVPVELVIQQLLDHVFGTGVIALYTPVSPGVGVTSYEQKAGGPVLDAIRELAFGAGADVRYRYDAAGLFRLTLWIPQRTKTVVDTTLAAHEYFALPKLRTPIDGVRNAITVYYHNTAGQRLEQTYVNAASVAKYQRRHMPFEAGPTTTTASQALALAQAIGHDLGAPPSEQSVRLRHWWAAQLGDLYGFTANGTHYDTDQALAVVGAEHTLDATAGARCVLETRGTVAGAYNEWIRRGRDTVPDPAQETPGIPRAILSEVVNAGTAVTFAGDGSQTSGTGALEWQAVQWTDGTSEPDWPAEWETDALPVQFTIARDLRKGKHVAFRVRDAAGRISDTAFGLVLASNDAITEDGELADEQELYDVRVHRPLDGPPEVRWSRGPRTRWVFVYAWVRAANVEFPRPALDDLFVRKAIGDDAHAVTNPARGQRTFVQLEARTVSGSVLAVRRTFVDPVGPVLDWTVEATEPEAGVGRVAITLDDAGGFIDATTARIAFTVTAAGGTTVHAPTTAPTPGATSGVYTFDLALDPKHVLVVHADALLRTGETVRLGTWPFDSDKIAHVRNVAPAREGSAARITATFDTDTAIGAGKAAWSVDDGETWTPVEVLADLTAVFQVPLLSSAGVLHVRAQNALGDWGPALTVDLPPANPELDVRVTPGALSHAIVYTARGTVEVSIDGMPYSVAPASPIVVPRPAAGQPAVRYTFRARVDGQVHTAEVFIPALDQDTVTPDLVVTPFIPAWPYAPETHQGYTVSATHPGTGAAVPVYVTLRGTTGYTGTGIPLSDGVAHLVVMPDNSIYIARPAFGPTWPATVEVRAALAGGSPATIQHTIANQVKTAFGPSVQTTVTKGETEYAIAYTGIGVILLSVNGGPYLTPPASPVVVARTTSEQLYDFIANADARVAQSLVYVPPLAVAGEPTTAVVERIYVTATDFDNDQLTLGWSFTGALSGGLFEVVRVRTAGSTPNLGNALVIEGGSIGTSLIVSTPDDIISTSAGKVTYSYQVRVKNAGGTVLRTSEWLHLTLSFTL